MIELIALKKCGKYNVGDAFLEKKSKAKLLVAIKSARYMTRDMTADTGKTEIIVIDEEIPEKRGRGRPRLNPDIEQNSE